MAKREKSSLHEKVKQFFGIKEAAPPDFSAMKREAHVISSDELKDLMPDNSLNHRLKSLRELYEIVSTKKLEQYAVEAICHNIKDLLSSQSSIETRHIVLQFYTALIYGQIDQLDIMRNYFYNLIVKHNVEEDTFPRFYMLKALTQNGKNIDYFEEEIGSFLLNWFSIILATEKSAEFLYLVTNVIKYNAAYIDDDVIDGFIRNILSVCGRPKNEDDVQESLNILEALLVYSHLPISVLKNFIYTLCLTVNIEKFVPCSWKHMRNMLGTSVGYRGIELLCMILQESYQHPKLIRGAIFFVGMALWSNNKVQTLKHSPEAILPSFLKPLDTKSIIIAYEIILSLQRLVENKSEELLSMSWNMMFAILQKILEYPQLKSTKQLMYSLPKAVHEFLTLLEERCPLTSTDNLYCLIESCADFRDEQSVIRLVLHIAESISPHVPDFIAKIDKLLEKFFIKEKRHKIQLKTLEEIRKIRCHNFYKWKDDRMDKTIYEKMFHAETNTDVNVRKTAVCILLDIAGTCTKTCFYEVLDLIEKIMGRMFNDLPDGNNNEGAYSDVLTAVQGLISVFKKQLFMMPSNRCVKIFNLFINHIQMHYQKLSYIEEVVQIRKLVLELLIYIRCKSKRRIGVLENDSIEFSVYILCGSEAESKEVAPLSPLPGSPSSIPSIYYLNYNKAYQVIVTCLKDEKDWRILEMVLKNLPLLLQNKTLLLCGNTSVTSLCATLNNMVNDRNFGVAGFLKNTPGKLTRTDIHTHIFPCVSALISYSGNMEPYMQRVLIKCLQSGLVSRSAKICMEGLILCTLEMQSSMMKLLPDVLLKLSKISATVTVAVPVLEFLSYLIRLPKLYVSFVEDQYMSIFAIALPYTNPFKFNQYIVALAHHVIAMWFLKCRIPFRREFAKFITKGLRNNLIVPRDHGSGSSHADQSGGLSEMSTEAILALHTELMETGLDLMARFTFGMAANVAKRSPAADFLLENGQKSSWLVGNRIVTITTSGCGTKTFKHGLCERCYLSCKELSKDLPEGEIDENINFESPASSPSKKENFSAKRKRHRSAVQSSTTRTSEISLNANQTKDDLLLHCQKERHPSLLERHQSEFLPSTDIFESLSKQGADGNDKEERVHHLCSCWCATWAEIHIRRPTGTNSWMMNIQNQLTLPSPYPDIPLSLLESLVLPQKKEIELDQEIPSSGTDSECSATDSDFKETTCEGAIDITSTKKPPMRRTNSSPDMNTGWSNFESFQQEKKTMLGDSVESVEEKLGSINLKESESAVNIKEQSTTKKSLKLNLKSGKADITTSERRLQFAKESIHSAPVDPYKESQESNTSAFRDRGHTISVMSPSRPTGSGNPTMQPDVSRRSGMNPSFVFLHLFHDSFFGNTAHKPLHILQTEANNRALTVLDLIPPYDTHKIGIIYIGPGQTDNEVEILSNEYGSPRYLAFIERLGHFVMLTDTERHSTYLGGLDTKGEDGQFTFVWHDNVMQVVFHIATFMPNKKSDVNRNEKKKHIANDCVMIAYNESGKDFKMETIKGHVTNACIVISPEDLNSNVVTVKYKAAELGTIFGHTESYIVSDASLSIFVRQLALHANLASRIISRRQQSANIHVSNWLERLRTIKRLRAKLVDEQKKMLEASGGFELAPDPGDYDDFTDYV